jgi:glycine C-acetyltransferase
MKHAPSTTNLPFVKEELDRLRESGLYNEVPTLGSAQGSWIEVNGKRVLNLCSNNYLGLANDPRLVEASKRALDEYGIGPGAVRSIAGTMELHVELEKKLAAFKGAEAAISVQSGFLANQATIPNVCSDAEDAIITDELNHASIIDAARLTKARRLIYRHNDIADLRAKLGDAKGARRKLVVTDGVFSMDGDIAPLPQVVEAAEEAGAMVMVDDAHGEGVLGKHGRGIVNHFELEGRVHFEVGTLSKAFGVVGGFITGDAETIDFLRQKARPFLFSSALTPPDVAAAIAAVDILSESDRLVKKLWENTATLVREMKSMGFDTGVTATPIVPVMLGEAPLAQQFSKMLFERGVFAKSIGFPTVPRGKARIRVMNSAAHTREDLTFALDAFREVGKALGVLN